MAQTKILTSTVISGSLNVTTGITGSYFGDGSQLINLPSSHISGAITGALVPYSTTQAVSGAIAAAILPYASQVDVTSSIANFATRTEVSGAITGSLTASAIANFTSDIRIQLSGAGSVSYDPATGIISSSAAGGGGTTNAVTSSNIYTITKLTRAEYYAIATPVSSTLYLITQE